MLDRETEIRVLLGSGLAHNRDHAIAILDEMEAKRKRADLYIFFMDPHLVRGALGQYMVDERPYNSTTARVATVPSGAISQMMKTKSAPDGLAIGALKEFAPRPNDDGHIADAEAKLVAVVRDFLVEGKSGVFLSPYSAEAVRARGGQTFDERENLHRIEFGPIGGDFVLGMFQAWNEEFRERASLMLYMSRLNVVTL